MTKTTEWVVPFEGNKQGTLSSLVTTSNLLTLILHILSTTFTVIHFVYHFDRLLCSFLILKITL